MCFTAFQTVLHCVLYCTLLCVYTVLHGVFYTVLHCVLYCATLHVTTHTLTSQPWHILQCCNGMKTMSSPTVLNHSQSEPSMTFQIQRDNISFPILSATPPPHLPWQQHQLIGCKVATTRQWIFTELQPSQQTIMNAPIRSQNGQRQDTTTLAVQVKETITSVENMGYYTSYH